jgi:LPS O-antigen subunit length determinant protein (WzzB/FepE family)
VKLLGIGVFMVEADFRVGEKVLSHQKSCESEINFFEFLGMLWESRWFVIWGSSGAAICGLLAFLVVPSTYYFVVPISPAPASTFIPYLPLNEVIRKNGFEYHLDEEKTFSMFVSELNDYQEFIDVLGRDKGIVEELEGIKAEEKRAFLIAIAKEFKLIESNDGGWFITFEWGSVDGGKAILHEVLSEILTNVKHNIVADIVAFRYAAEQRRSYKKADVEASIQLIKKTTELDNKQRLLFLSEQAAIARELGLKIDSLDINGLVRQDEGKSLLSVFSSGIPFYLRGYKAIDKEVELIASRSSEELLSLNKKSVELQKELIELENHVGIEQLDSGKVFIEQAKPEKWVIFNIELANVSENKSFSLYILLPALLGAFFGALVIITISMLRDPKNG